MERSLGSGPDHSSFEASFFNHRDITSSKKFTLGKNSFLAAEHLTEGELEPSARVLRLLSVPQSKFNKNSLNKTISDAKDRLPAGKNTWIFGTDWIRKSINYFSDAHSIIEKCQQLLLAADDLVAAADVIEEGAAVAADDEGKADAAVVLAAAEPEPAVVVVGIDGERAAVAKEAAEVVPVAAALDDAAVPPPAEPVPALEPGPDDDAIAREQEAVRHRVQIDGQERAMAGAREKIESQHRKRLHDRHVAGQARFLAARAAAQERPAAIRLQAA